MEHHRAPVQVLETGRVENLADGVFSIVMTLMVFELTLPTTEPPAPPRVTLVSLWPKFLAYAISFALLGIYWLGHRSQFNYIKRADHVSHWLNILFLSCVSLVPFSTKMLGRFPLDRTALSLYGANLIVIGLVLYWKWVYAVHGHWLVEREVPAMIVRFGTLRCLLAPACYALGIGLAFVNPTLTLLLYAGVPALQRFWLHLAGG
jgi:uncharacterized membrane protein